MYVQRLVSELVNYLTGDVKKQPCFMMLEEVNMSNRTKRHVTTLICLVKKPIVEREKFLGPGNLNVVCVNEHCTSQM